MRYNPIRLYVLAGTALALVACTAEDPEKSQVEIGLEADEADEERLIAALAEAEDVNYEITGIVNRLERECMEDKGFTVHDETVWYQPEPLEDDGEQLQFEAPSEQIPTAEEASESGFMAWAVTYEGKEDAPPDPEEAMMEPYWELLDGPYYDLSGDEQDAWDRAYYGVEVVRDRGDTSEDYANPPEPGGCSAEVKRAVYGEPYKWHAPDDPSYVSWAWAEENPLYKDWNQTDQLATWRDLTREEERAFLTCLDEGGNPGWELNDDGYVDTYWWLKDLYQPDPANAGIEFDPLPEDLVNAMPEVPADAPYDYDKAFGIEIALAEDFAACADETGYREAGQTQWRAIHIGRMLDHEAEVFAWQETMNGYLATAQDLLEA
jgi:hypothetical protein